MQTFLVMVLNPLGYDLFDLLEGMRIVKPIPDEFNRGHSFLRVLKKRSSKPFLPPAASIGGFPTGMYSGRIPKLGCLPNRVQPKRSNPYQNEKSELEVLLLWKRIPD